MLESVHVDDGFTFNYAANVNSTGFVTKATLQEQKLGTYVSMLLFITHAEEKATATEKPEKYVTIHACDTNGDLIGPMRFWRWEEDDVIAGITYVIPILDGKNP